ncbi:TPA: hypothetical protein PXS11_001011 [Yersinia enterocolitica]|nr:hypothetical protein [Yersinia enterocolitica]
MEEQITQREFEEAAKLSDKTFLPTIQSKSRIIYAADAAMSAVENSFPDFIESDHYLYRKLARAALQSALAALGEDY